MTSHPLTVEMLEESHLLLIGQSRSGKTYQLRGALEQLRRADRRVGAIDKVGNHWGLTLSPDGKSPGLDFMIFGGKRAIIPMTPDQGALLGRVFVERSIPAIFDVSQWTQEEQRRWVADFADAVFRFNEGALHLGVDEAQSWMPINGGGPAFQNMLRIVEQGLNNGIRLMMSVQRLARLDATARGMSPLVLAMRQTSNIDRNAVADLMAIDAPVAAMLKRELPGLPPGTGFIWDPGNDGLVKHAFPRNLTFDSSRTPRHGDTKIVPIAVSSALVDELRAALAPPAPALAPGDLVPHGAAAAIVQLKGRIAELEAKNAELDAECNRWVAGIGAIDDLIGLVKDGGAPPQLPFRTSKSHPHDAKLHSLDASSGTAPDLSTGSAPERTAGVASGAEGASRDGGLIPPKPGRGAPANPHRKVRTDEQKGAGVTTAPLLLNRTAIEMASMLLAAAPDGFTWDDGLLLIGRRPNSGDSRLAKKGLLLHQLMRLSGSQCVADDALLESADIGVAHWPGPPELRDLWADKLRGPGGEILRDLFANGPASNTTVAARLGKSPTSGWWRQGIRDLRRSNVVTDREGTLQLHPFFTGEY